MSAPNLIGLAPRKNESNNSQRKIQRVDWLMRESVPGNRKCISNINEMINRTKNLTIEKMGLSLSIDSNVQGVSNFFSDL